MSSIEKNDCSSPEPFRPCEWAEIMRHKYFLSQNANRSISVEETIMDWMRHHARDWRKHDMREACRAQAEEILKHKWIESEKAGYDIGKAAAVRDWICKHAAAWRRAWEKNEL